MKISNIGPSENIYEDYVTPDVIVEKTATA